MHSNLNNLEKIYNNGKFSENGLTDEQVQQSKKIYGRNVLTQKKKTTLFKRIINALCEPMVLILVFAFLIAVGVNIGNFYAGSEVDLFEPIGIFLSIAISVGLTVIMERKSEKAFEALKSFTDNISVTVYATAKKD